MNEFDPKINTRFPGLVVRKDLVKTVKGNAIVPSCEILIIIVRTGVTSFMKKQVLLASFFMSFFISQIIFPKICCAFQRNSKIYYRCES